MCIWEREALPCFSSCLCRAGTMAWTRGLFEWATRRKRRKGGDVIYMHFIIFSDKMLHISWLQLDFLGEPKACHVCSSQISPCDTWGWEPSYQCTLTATCSLFVTSLNWLQWFLYSSFYYTQVLWFPNHNVKSVQLLTSHVEKQCWIYKHAVCLEALPHFSLKNLFRLHKINRQEPLGFHLVVLPLFCLASQLSIDPKVRLLFVARPKWQPPTLTMLLSSYHQAMGATLWCFGSVAREVARLDWCHYVGYKLLYPAGLNLAPNTMI